MQAVGGQICAALAKRGFAALSVVVDAVKDAPLDAPEMAANLGFGAMLRSYRFDKYRTTEKKDKKPTLKSMRIQCEGPGKARKAFAPLGEIAEGVFLTRDLVSGAGERAVPGNPGRTGQGVDRVGRRRRGSEQGADRGTRHGRAAGRRPGAASTSRGSSSCAGLGGENGDDQPIAIIGKGVTFDTGGISIKPSAGMEDMKWDMGGAGVVIGLMRALAGREAKANVVGVIGLVENMPSGTAQRPGDVVTSMSGQTIEVVNTDAEGRLVLGDVLHYAK